NISSPDSGSTTHSLPRALTSEPTAKFIHASQKYASISPNPKHKPPRLTARVNPTLSDPPSTTPAMRRIAPCIVGLTLAVNLGGGSTLAVNLGGQPCGGLDGLFLT